VSNEVTKESLVRRGTKSSGTGERAIGTEIRGKSGSKGTELMLDATDLVIEALIAIVAMTAAKEEASEIAETARTAGRTAARTAARIAGTTAASVRVAETILLVSPSLSYPSQRAWNDLKEGKAVRKPKACPAVLQLPPCRPELREYGEKFKQTSKPPSGRLSRRDDPWKNGQLDGGCDHLRQVWLTAR